MVLVENAICQTGASSLEELIRAVADGKVGSETETVIAMLQARIGRLAPGPRRAVLAAAVYGQTFWQAGVARILGFLGTEPEVDEWLQVLCASEIIEAHGSSRIAEQREFGFRHALVRDAAYALLSASDKELGHKLAAEFLEAADKQVASALLAYHFRQAGLAEKALHHYLQAGERATQLGLYPEARLHYTAASEVIGLLVKTPKLHRLQADILLKLVNSGMALQGASAHLELLSQARALIDTLPFLADEEREDRLRVARIEFYYARIYLYGGQSARALPCFQRVLPIAREFDDQELLALTCQVLGMTELSRGLVSRAIETMAPLLGLAGQPFWHKSGCAALHHVPSGGAGLERPLSGRRGLDGKGQRPGHAVAAAGVAGDRADASVAGPHRGRRVGGSDEHKPSCPPVLQAERSDPA